MEGKRRRRRLWPWLAALAVLGGLAAYNYWPAEPVKIIISRETTYILGPLNPDGTPNYVKYLDDKYSQGVTAENNAAPLLLRAFGPELLPAEIRAESLRRLNLPSDIFDHDKHFIGWKDRARDVKADANGTGDANDANSSSPLEKEGDESASEPNFNDVFKMLLAGQVHPDLEAWLAGNSGPLELIRQATTRERFYVPLVSTSTPPRMTDIQIPNFQVFQQTGVALAARATLKMMRDDPAGAWEAVLAVHRMARLLSKDTPTLIHHLAVLGCEEIAAEVGTVIATRYPMSPAEGRNFLSRLAAIEPRGNIVDAIDEGDRFIGLDVVMTCSRGAPIDDSIPGAPAGRAKLNADWNRVLHDMNWWYDRAFAPLHLARFNGRKEAVDAFDKGMKALGARTGDLGTLPGRVMLLRLGGRLTKQALTRAVSDTLVCNLIPELSGACNVQDKANMALDIETLAVALACFHAEQGRWPAELKELCPSLLKEIPADRFSEKPLVYRPVEKGYLLYSVGRNLRDDGGQRERIVGGKVVNKGADDIAAEVKPVEAASKPAASQP